MSFKEPIARHWGHHHGRDNSPNHARGGGAAEYVEPLVELTRVGLAESVHRGAVCVCASDGKRARGLGHPAVLTFMRPAAEPLQALPVIASGAVDRFGYTAQELACMCGSLNLENCQAEAISAILGQSRTQHRSIGLRDALA